MVVRFLATKVLPAVAVTSAAITIYSSSAHAFFPPVPIGSDVVVTPPTSPISPLPPPVSPPPIPPLPPPVSPPPVSPPPVSPPPVDPGCHPNQVPEPATMVTGLIGLSVLGAGALRKKFGKKADGGESAKS